MRGVVCFGLPPILRPLALRTHIAVMSHGHQGLPAARHSQDATCARGGAVRVRVESRGTARSSVLRGHAVASRTAPRPCAPASVPTSQPSGFSASEQGIRSSGWKRIRFSTSERKRELALKFREVKRTFSEGKYISNNSFVPAYLLLAWVLSTPNQQ